MNVGNPTCAAKQEVARENAILAIIRKGLPEDSDFIATVAQKSRDRVKPAAKPMTKETKELIEKQIQVLVEAQKFKEAGRKANEIGDTRRAQMLFRIQLMEYDRECGIHYGKSLLAHTKDAEVAVQVFEESRMFEYSAKSVTGDNLLLLKQAKVDEDNGLYKSAADVYRELGDTTRFKELYEKQVQADEEKGHFNGAILLAEKALGTERAIQVCDNAANVAEEIGAKDRAVAYREIGSLLRGDSESPAANSA